LYEGMVVIFGVWYLGMGMVYKRNIQLHAVTDTYIAQTYMYLYLQVSLTLFVVAN